MNERIEYSNFEKVRTLVSELLGSSSQHYGGNGGMVGFGTLKKKCMRLQEALSLFLMKSQLVSERRQDGSIRDSPIASTRLDSFYSACRSFTNAVVPYCDNEPCDSWIKEKQEEESKKMLVLKTTGKKVSLLSSIVILLRSSVIYRMFVFLLVGRLADQAKDKKRKAPATAFHGDKWWSMNS